MACPKKDFNNILMELDGKWNHLKSLQQLKIADVEELCQDTLSRFILDFRALPEFGIIDPVLKEKFNTTLTSIQFTSDSDMMDMVENMTKAPKWDSPVAIQLLAGRLLSRSVKNLLQHEKMLLAEEDNVIQARIQCLVTLLETSNSDECSQMILNALETYKCLLICEPDLQNKLSCKTLESLVQSLLIILSHRKEYDHLNSMIKFLPIHRKIQFILKHSSSEISKDSVKLRQCKLFVCVAIIHDLLQTEFAKPIDEQNTARFNLYINLLIEMALQDSFVDRQLEKLILSATDMGVVSDYYYLAANLLRLKMSLCHEDLVIKLISIGLSHDLSFLEKVKYSKTKDGPQWNEEKFVEVYRKMFMALMVLGFIVKDYDIRRLCVQAANACEPATNFAAQVLTTLPECTTIKAENNPKMQETLCHLREQLESFQSAIRMNVKLASTWSKASLVCYNNLDHLNHRIELGEDLLPLVYPGIEKYLKRPRKNTVNSEDEEEQKVEVEKKPLDALKILSDSKDFAEVISSRLKLLKNPFKIENLQQQPLPSEVTGLMIRVLNQSADFEISGGLVFMKLSEQLTVKSLHNYICVWEKINEEQLNLNQPNLFFDFNMTRNPSSECNIPAMFQQGVVRVRDLCESGYNIFDIGNVMLYTMLEKKMLFMHQEFTVFNKNWQQMKIPEQTAFNYLTCRTMPEYGRLMKLVTTGYAQCGMLEFLIKNFKFEVEPGHYYAKSLIKIKKTAINDKSSASNHNDTQDSQGIDAPKENTTAKTVTPKNKPTRDLTRPPRNDLVRPPKSDVGRISKNGQSKSTKYSRENIQETPLVATETLHASQEIINLFKLIEDGLSTVIGAPANFDLTQLCDESSVNKASLTYKATTDDFYINYQKQRNGQTGPPFFKKMTLPARIHGSLLVKLDYTDTIVYDENLDNPTVQSSFKLLVTGALAFDHVSHNIKNFNMDCVVKGFRNRILVTFRNGSRSKPKQMPGKAFNDNSPKGARQINGHSGKPITVILDSNATRSNGPHSVEEDGKPVISEADSSQPPESFHNIQTPTEIFDRTTVNNTPVKIVALLAPPQFVCDTPVSPGIVSPLFTETATFPNESFSSENGEGFHHMATSTAQFSHLNGYNHPPPPMNFNLEDYSDHQQVHAPDQFIQNIKVEPDIASFGYDNVMQEATGQHFDPQVDIKHEPEMEVTPTPEVVHEPQVTELLVIPAAQAEVMQPEQFSVLPHVKEELQVQPVMEPEIVQQCDVPKIVQPIKPQQHRTEPDQLQHKTELVELPPKIKLEVLQPKIEHEASPPKTEPVRAKIQILQDQVVKPKKIRTNNDNRARPLSKKLNGAGPKSVKMLAANPPVIDGAIDFEAQLDCFELAVPKLRTESVIKKVVRHDTPPTSPPPIRTSHGLLLPRAVEPKNLQKRKDMSADRILNNTPPKDETVIDLTVEAVPDPFMQFVKNRTQSSDSVEHCVTVTEDPLAVNLASDEEDDTEQQRIWKKMQRLGRPLSQSQSTQDSKRARLELSMKTRPCEVRLVNVLQNIDTVNPRPRINVELLKLYLPTNRPNFRPNHQDFVLKSDDLEQPLVDPLDAVTDIRQSTFHIVYHNSNSRFF